MITIYDEATDKTLGTLTEAQLQFLMDHLEEESAEDTDFYINQATVDMLEQDGADAGLLKLLRTALGAREDMDMRWVRGG
jgi:processive 1,2-diacylglycerol beta-glucosyltransferase